MSSALSTALLTLGVLCSIVGPLLVGFASMDVHKRVLGVLFFVCNAWIFAGEPIIRLARTASEILAQVLRGRG